MEVIALVIILMVVGFLAVAVYLSIRWDRLKTELFPQFDIVALNNEISPKNESLQNRRWLKDIQLIIAGANRAVEREKSSEIQVQTESFQKIESIGAKFAEAVRSVITKSLETAELHTLLVNIQGLYVYVVVIPNRHEYPHLIRRYSPFSAGWVYHINLIKNSLAHNGDALTLIGYLFFLSPDFKEGIVLVSYADAQTDFVPGTLVYDAELELPNVKIWNASLEFSMSKK